MSWQTQVYGGCKSIVEDGDGSASESVHKSPDCATGPETKVAVKKDAAVADSAIAACIAKVNYLREQGYSWRDIAGIAGIPSGTAWHYWHGTARPDANFVLCIMNHNAAKCTLVLPCPDCGEVHDAGRCYNRPIFAVVILSPGQRVTALPKPPAKRRTPYAAISIPRALREELDRLRQARGETWEDLLSRLKVLAQPLEG